LLPSPPAFAGASQQTDDPRRAELYNCWYANRDRNPSAAYDCGKRFLAQYGTANDLYAAAVEKFVWEYDNPEKVKFEGLFRLVDAGAEANQPSLLAKLFTVGQSLVRREPNNLSLLIRLGHAGFIAQKRKITTYDAEVSGYAKNAIKQIEAGQTPDESFRGYPQVYLPVSVWIPFLDRDDALAHLNYTLGVIDQPKAPDRAAVSFFRALQYESLLKKDALIHALLGIAYDTSAWEAASRRYKTLDNAPQPDRDAALRDLFATTDRLLVYYAHAVALAGSDAANKQVKDTASARLEVLYKFRHENSTAGMPEFLTTAAAAGLADPAAPLETAAPTP
jgi:hypothetical protein